MSDFQEIQARALAIRQKYSQLNEGHGHASWDGKAFAMGFVGDVGDLLKLVMAKENYRTLKGVDNVDNKLKHELSDCLWSIFAIANYYSIDMEAAFMETMDEIETRIAGGVE
jgi:NTP pyrophosphatase (non-canonical NTP hydrolase)